MKKLLAWLGWLLAFFGAFALTAVIFADTVLTKIINRAGCKVTHVETQVKETDLSFRKGLLVLNGIELKNPEGFKTPRMIYVERLSLVVSPKSLLRNQIAVKKIELSGAELTYEAAGFGQSNFSVFVEDLRKRTRRHRWNGQPRGEERFVTIDHLSVEGGRVTLSAVFSKGKGIILPLPPIDIHDIGKDKKLGVSEAVVEVLRLLGLSALAAADEREGV